jgi:signal transduction histidine kinase
VSPDQHRPYISLLAGWLEEELGDQLPRQAKGYVDQLRERAASVDSLIAGLRQYALAGSREHPGTPIDLPSLVREIVKLQDPPPGFRFEVDVSPQVITAAEPPLAMILRNLVANAIKHHDRPAGVVRIRSRPCEGGGAVEFAVEDDGPGIEPRLRERVFDVFQSFGPGLKPVGDGVGLALVRRTVTAHRGKLWLEFPGGTAPAEGAAAGGAPRAPDAARGGRGTTIRFTWPTLGGLPA